MRRAIPIGLSMLLMLAVSGFSANPGEDQEGGKKGQGWIGVSIQDITSRIAKQKNLKSRDGAYIVEVLDDSPAESAGLEKGDVIIEFGGKAIADADELTDAVRGISPGTKTSIVTVRKGEKKTFQITAGKMPKAHSAFSFSLPRMKSPVIKVFRGGHSLGLQLMELNPQLGEYFGVPEGEGVLVEKVEQKSAGEKAGFKAGDVILRIGKRSINDIGDVRRALESYEEETKVDAEILRKGVKKTLSVEIETSEDDVDGSAWFHSLPQGEGLHGFGIEIPIKPRIRIERELEDLQGLEKLRRFRNIPDFIGFPKSI